MSRYAPHDKNWLALSLPALLLLLPLAGCGNTEAKFPGQPESKPSPIAVSTTAAEERLLSSGLDVTGTLMADAATDLASDIDGRVVQVPIERGTIVKAGAVLVRLDDRDATNQLREAEATEAQTRERLGLTNGQAFDPLVTPDVRQARALVDRADADFRRYARLVEEGAVSRSEHDLKRAEFLTAKEQSESTVNQARQLYQVLLAQRARVAMARKALEDTLIRAPYNGLVAEKFINVGSYAKKGERLATVVRVDPLRIELSVPEGAITAVRKSQKVSFTVQAYPDRRFEGTIAYVGPALRTDSRALVVEAIVPNAQGALQPGLFATARIELPGTRPSILVPASAVRTEAGISRLYILNGDRAEQRIVQLGREAEALVEIVRGVSAGDRVIAQASDRLSDGTPVTATQQGGR